jgi:phage-related tail fiber protein
VTVDAKGRVTGGTNPTTLSGYGITDALNLSGGTLTGALVLAADPTLPLHPATKQYVDNFVTGLDVKVSVRAISTSNITLSGTQTIDGVALIAGDRVLVAGQTTQTANGIYVVAAGAWSRATDADNTGSTSEVSSGMYTFVEAGTANASTGWVLNTPNPITLGSSNLTFTQFTGLGEITAGAGLTKTGATISVSGGVSGSFTSANAKTITVTNGIITAIV